MIGAKKKSILAGVVGAFLILNAPGVALGAPKVSARSWAVVDGSGRLLGGRYVDERRPIASITKMMMAMALLDADPELAGTWEVSEDDVDTLKKTHSRLDVGSRLPRADLLLLALASSENRAAAALSRSYPGGRQAHVAAMNAKARSLGLRSLSFVDPTGLSPQNQGSARDVAKMALAASSYQKIRAAAKVLEYEQAVGARGDQDLSAAKTLAYKNTSKPLREGLVSPIVSKTGYTSEAGKCVAWALGRGGAPRGFALLGSPSFKARDADELKLSHWDFKAGR